MKHDTINKINSTFHISNTYEVEDIVHKTNKEQRATVILTISYVDKSFSINPLSDAGFNKGFHFNNASHNYLRWKAILKCIDQAIDFANTELNITNNTPEIKQIL